MDVLLGSGFGVRALASPGFAESVPGLHRVSGRGLRSFKAYILSIVGCFPKNGESHVKQ